MVTTVPDTLQGFLLPFAGHFRSRGFRVDAMAEGVTGQLECVETFDHVWEVSWSRNPLDRRNLFAARRRVRDVVATQGYDLVHVHTPVAAFVTRLALRGLRRAGWPRVIYTAHGFHFYRGGPQPRSAAFRALEKLAGRWTDYLVVINREDEQSARRLVPPERVRYMPGIGVEVNRYGPHAVSEDDVAQVRRELAVAPGDPLFLMVAEFTPGKRHRDALDAFARIARRDARLAFAGTGTLVEAMKRRATDLAIASRVHFLGLRRDIPAVMRAAVAVLLPSDREGLPRSVMESLSSSVPVVGTRIRGTADLVQEGCGLLVPVGDTAALAGAMAWILDHPDEAREMGRRGRERMADYDVHKIIALHEALYETALAARPAGGDLATAQTKR
jgi:glycosyltransferase involved in cell wall biosynthesis